MNRTIEGVWCAKEGGTAMELVPLAELRDDLAGAGAGERVFSETSVNEMLAAKDREIAALKELNGQVEAWQRSVVNVGKQLNAANDSNPAEIAELKERLETLRENHHVLLTANGGNLAEIERLREQAAAALQAAENANWTRAMGFLKEMQKTPTTAATPAPPYTGADLEGKRFTWRDVPYRFNRGEIWECHAASGTLLSISNKFPTIAAVRTAIASGQLVEVKEPQPTKRPSDEELASELFQAWKNDAIGSDHWKTVAAKAREVLTPNIERKELLQVILNYRDAPAGILADAILRLLTPAAPAKALPAEPSKLVAFRPGHTISDCGRYTIVHSGNDFWTISYLDGFFRREISQIFKNRAAAIAACEEHARQQVAKGAEK